MSARVTARSSRALFPAADPAISGLEQLAGEYLEGPWRIERDGRTYFRRALRASAHDIGTACGHVRRDPSPGYVHSLTDKSKPQSRLVEWPNVLFGAVAARRESIFLPCPNTRSLCLSLCDCNQVVRH